MNSIADWIIATTKISKKRTKLSSNYKNDKICMFAIYTEIFTSMYKYYIIYKCMCLCVCVFVCTYIYMCVSYIYTWVKLYSHTATFSSTFMFMYVIQSIGLHEQNEIVIF